MYGYNGWENRETWLVALWFGDNLQDIRDEGEEITPKSVEAYVWDIIEDYDLRVRSGFMYDILSGSLSKVNWEQISDNLNETY